MNARIPREAQQAMALGCLSPLNKVSESGAITGVRGICTGDFMYRLVARIFAQMHGDELAAATAPYQMALGS